MEYRTLGRTGLRVSAVALGCEGFADRSDEQVRADFDYALSAGINFLDLYASSPRLRSAVGAALRGRRDRIIIQGHLCSVWEEGQYLRSRDPGKMRAAFADLLERLETDHVEIGMIHYVDSEADLQQVLEGPVMAYARQLLAEGRIRHIGLSSHNPEVALRAAQTGLIDVLLFSLNPCYDLLPPSDDVETLWADASYSRALHDIDPARQRLYAYCAREGVGINVMKAYGGGDLLSGERSPLGRALTPVQCIEYALARPGVAAVMVGCRSREEIDAALAWCRATPEERDYTRTLVGLERFSWQGHCMYCGHCAPCSAGIDIAAVNKFYNLTTEEGIPETVREHYRTLRSASPAAGARRTARSGWRSSNGCAWPPPGSGTDPRPTNGAAPSRCRRRGRFVPFRSRNSRGVCPVCRRKKRMKCCG